MTGAGAVLNVLKPQPGSSIAVFGCGAVGLAAVMAARAAGCESVIAVEPDERRRDLAIRLGATEAHVPGTRLRGLDHSVETVGSSAVVEAAIACLASPGSCATLGFRGPRNPVEIDQGRLLFGRTLTGVIEGDGDPHATIGRLLDLHSAGAFPFDSMIERYPIEDVAQALDDTRTGRVIKAVLVV